MIRYLSSEWFAAAADALAGLTVDPSMSLELEQRVTLDGSEIVYHLRFADGLVSIAEGPARNPDVRLTQPWTIAVGVARGGRSAQAAFIAGDLRIGGDVRRLIDAAPSLAGLDDALAGLRARTDFDAPPATATSIP